MSKKKKNSTIKSYSIFGNISIHLNLSKTRSDKFLKCLVNISIVNLMWDWYPNKITEKHLNILSVRHLLSCVPVSVVPRYNNVEG